MGGIKIKILIKNGRVLDPRSHTDEKLDILVEGELIRLIDKEISIEADRVIDANNYWVVPGLIDAHVHLREPGFEHKETIRTGSKSAARGGFTSIACMPNTQPAIDKREIVDYILNKARAEAVVNVLPIGAISKGQLGKEASNIADMLDAGVIAISEDGKTVMDTELMRRSLELAAQYDIPVLVHCEDHYLVGKGVMNEGERATKLGLEGISSVSEEIIVLRDIYLSKEFNTKLHLCHISTKGTVEILRQAKKRGLRVTAEVCPHHFTLTDADVRAEDTNTKMNPPLRSYEDVKAIKKALGDGTIDIIATDHAPHHRDEKRLSYEEAPFGIVGLETAVPLVITELVNTGIISPLQMVEKMSQNPARLLGIDRGSLMAGKIADITIIDPDFQYTIDAGDFVSKGKNTPFHGREVKGRVEYTIVGGKIVLDKGGRLIDR